MSSGASSLAAFHLIGDRSRLAHEEADLRGLAPALFSHYRDLSVIRHDYPVILADTPTTGYWVRSLTDLVNDLLQLIAPPGSNGEEIRRQVLCLEQIIRQYAASGRKGSLSSLWEAACKEMTSGDASEQSEDSLFSTLLSAGEKLPLDGEVVDCDQDLAIRLVTRAWHQSEQQKAQRLSKQIVALTQKLRDILTVDYMQSGNARKPGKLESTMGTANQSVFDFDAMSRVLQTAPVAPPLPKQRQDRIRAAIEVLESQRFTAPQGGVSDADMTTFRFVFTDARQAVAAYRKRLPDLAALVRAVAIGRLEIDNRYDESHHDQYFALFDENQLGPADMAPFSSYLLYAEETDTSSMHSILEILRAGLPFKIVASSSDILGMDSINESRLSFGTGGQHLARMSVGLDQVFVLQTASAGLYQLRELVSRGLACAQPALFSIFSGSGATPSSRKDAPAEASGHSTYLDSAAAMESRVFPSFVHDPSSGAGHAVRFSLEGNPQPVLDWPLQELAFEDATHNRQVEETAFTAVDFIAANKAYISRFACVPEQDWTDDMIPVHAFLGLDEKKRASKVPYVTLADEDGLLHRAVFDHHLIDAADRCLDAWHSLQELGGIHNSHAEALLSRARCEWETEKEKLMARTVAPKPATVPDPESAQTETQATPTTPVAADDIGTASDEPSVSSDDPWIETIRCTTCNECTTINDRMFAYNEDQRAYVADPDAGTYRELVEAAETCQVAIIHPGQPRNPDEPGLEELLERAEPFNT